MREAWLFVVTMAAVSVHVGWRGGSPERWACATMLAGTVATIVASFDSALKFKHIEWQLAGIDTVMLLVILGIALRADRFWPLWLAGLQSLAVAAHAARGLDPQIVPVAYWWMIGKISYPMILLLCIGIERHQYRKRLRNPEQSWSEMG